MANVLPDMKKEVNGAYPDDSIDPMKKDFAWHLQAAKALYQRQRNVIYLDNARRLDYIRNRLYADGNQPTTGYVDRIAKMKDKGKKVSYRDLNWGIVSTAPKVINAILGYWEKLDYNLLFDCINPIAAEDRRFIEAHLKTQMALKDFNAQIAQATGVGIDINNMIPESIEEIQTILAEGWRLPYEMEMELGVQMVQEENGWKKEMRRRIRREFIVNGVGFMKIWVDRISQRVKMRESDIVNGVIEDFYGCDGDASKGIGEVITMYIYEARLEWGDQFNDEEYYNMANSAVGEYGNPLQLGTYASYVNTDAQNSIYRPWDNFKIRVMDFEIWSCDRIKKEITNRKGYTETYHVDPKTPEYSKVIKGDGGEYTKEIKATDIKTVRGGKWIINTDYMADWGKKADIARPNDNKRECYRDFKFYRVANKSILETILPVLDMLQISVLNKQNVLSRAMPSGFTIEMGAFEKVLLDGKIKNSEELFTIAAETGNVVYRQQSTIDDEGRINHNKPVEWVDRDPTRAIQGWWEEIMNNIKLIQTISGINDMMDASTPPGQQGLGVSQLAIQGAENTLSPMIMGAIDLEEKAAYMIMLKLQVIARNGKIEGYTSLGNGFKQLITLGDNISALSYATRVQALPTVEQKAYIMEMIKEAVTSNLQNGQGGVDPADAIWLENYLATGGNLKVAYFMFNKFRKKAQDKMNADKAQADKANTDRLMASTQVAEKEKRDTEMLLHQQQLELEDRKGQWKIKEIQAQAQQDRTNILVDKETDKRVNAHKKSLEVAENS